MAWTNKKRVFVDRYLQTFNATQSARDAGYSEKTAYSAGSRLLKDVEVSEAIQTRLQENHMSADEALRLLSEMARGDIAKIMDVTNMGFSLDMQKAKEQGLTKLIKKVKQKTVTHIAKSESDEDREVIDLEVELYDAQSALDKILRVLGRYKDLGSKENPTNVILTVQYKDKPSGSNG